MSDLNRPEAVEEARSWQGDFDPFADQEERRVLFAAFDSYRSVITQVTRKGIFSTLNFFF